MSWDRIRGQDAARRALLTAIDSNRLGQAYLFVGPDGVGKRLFARELAKAFLCTKPPSKMAACDRCPACAQVEAESHPDLLFLRTPEGKHELPVAAMREFCANLARKPTHGSRKIGIVEDADDFNEESANSFLKTLEEPPPGTLLLLLGTGTDRQLPTILSRCQIVRFAPLTDADVSAILAERGIDDPVKRDRLARLGGGSAARALALDDDSIWEVRQKLVEGLTGPRPSFQPLAEVWAKFHEDAGKDKTAAQRMRASLVLKFLIEVVDRALKISLGVHISGADAVEAGRLRTFADRVGTDGLVELLDKCVEADFHVERRVQLILVVESVLEKFTRPGTRPSIS
ncbi:DNA polymerase III subunit [Frigoriglobus tundricola]|uniref:DNA polymerase III delta prime subunit n=1 Tax=Frigoriglobus tundricola TaxID=2774151 RepID=A0A6M5Z666_9BACT|nr:DNA polymerase III subunit delta' [Frigoriglobus tundricola]QJX00723.1 DNA polymerase III delta prime subunit [Frigoriglobus tundricola]